MFCSSTQQSCYNCALNIQTSQYAYNRITGYHQCEAEIAIYIYMKKEAWVDLI